MLLGHARLRQLFRRLTDIQALAHGYIFFGPAQVGKRTFAESLAHYLEGREFEPSAHILQDALVLGSDDQNIGIEAVRKIRAYLFREPTLSLRRLVVIDNAENLSLQAEQALLKITEEPPRSGLIIVIVSNPEALLPTLVSRFQKVYFPPVSESELASILPATRRETKASQELIRLAYGSPGRLFELLEEKNDLWKLARQILTANAEARKKMIKAYLDEERNPGRLLDAVILRLFLAPRDSGPLIQKALAVKRELSSLNLNPRLQLESIFF